MPNVIIYSTPTCGYCKVAKAYFAENNIAFEEKDVSVDMEARQTMLEKTNQMGVPVITIDDDVVIGFDKDRLAELLKIGA